MILTCDVLCENGFMTNHPEYVVKKFYCASDKSEKTEWRIMIEQDYAPCTNKLVFNVNMWKCDEKGCIVKRASLSDITTTEELNSIIHLCNIDKQLKN